MLIYKMNVALGNKRVIAGDGATTNVYADEESPEGWVRYKDVEPLLKRLAELEAKEQKREQFERESA